MYYNHFGLHQAPFRITPNTEFFFSGGNRGPILEALIYAISHGEGIIKVTGEVGSGKTMLCNMLPARLPSNIETVYLANPSVSPDEILHAIAFELQLGLQRNASRLEAMQALHQYLLKRHADGKRVVVFVEESQSMPIATLEEIRLLSNLETQYDKLLQIVLFGQPELDDNLRRPDIRQLRERIAHSFRLEPLNTGEIREYLMFRLRAAGYRGPDLFSAGVIKRMARASGGLTRRVNFIADKALLAAFSENTHTIRPKHVAAAIRDSEFGPHLRLGARPRYAWAVALVAIGAVTGAILYALVERSTRNTVSAAAVTVPAAPPLAPAVADINSIKTDSYEKPPESSLQPVITPPGPLASAAPGATAPTPAAAEPAGSTDKAPTSNEEDVVGQRITATQDWLSKAPQNTFSIQLMGTNDEQQLKHHLNVVGKFVEINKIFVYRTAVKQVPSITILYGSFDNYRAAQEALDKLPPFLKANRPILRTVQGIRAELKQQQNT